jgi:Helix-turn-helix domain of resolvase
VARLGRPLTRTFLQHDRHQARHPRLRRSGLIRSRNYRGVVKCERVFTQKKGRPPKLTPHQQRKAIKRRDRGAESLADIGRSYNVSCATISRLMHSHHRVSH